MKQSHKYYLPQLNALQRLEEFTEQVTEETKLIANQVEGKMKYISSTTNQKQSLCILIGPEGDFTENELNNVKSKKFTPISLGPHRLRTETAALYACMEANMMHRS